MRSTIPTGMVQGTRENARGIDLNRDYRHFASVEIRAHAAWLEQRVRRITHALHLHEDWESEGFYLYQRYGGLNYTLETPSAQEFPQRVKALKAAVLAII